MTEIKNDIIDINDEDVVLLNEINRIKKTLFSKNNVKTIIDKISSIIRDTNGLKFLDKFSENVPISGKPMFKLKYNEAVIRKELINNPIVINKSLKLIINSYISEKIISKYNDYCRKELLNNIDTGIKHGDIMTLITSAVVGVHVIEKLSIVEIEFAIY